MTLTRGEGGQNVMAPDFYDALGLTRTEELLIADQYMGVDQYFSRAADYGFFENPGRGAREMDPRPGSLRRRSRRTHDPAAGGYVSLCRRTGPDGHGHHQVAGELAQEVYNAAGDPTMFPEQIKRRTPALVALESLRARSVFPGHQAGMYDYAIDKFVPVKFFDYVTKTPYTPLPPLRLRSRKAFRPRPPA